MFLDKIFILLSDHFYGRNCCLEYCDVIPKSIGSVLLKVGG